MNPLAALFIRDIRLAIRVGGGGGIGVLFFLIVVVLMPFAVGPELTFLARLGPAILSLDLILMSDTPLEFAIAAKAAAHWLTTGLPLVIATPLLGLFMNLDAKASVAVSETEHPHVSNRLDIMALRASYTDADYILYAEDSGSAGADAARIALAGGDYELVERRAASRMALLRKKKPKP